MDFLERLWELLGSFFGGITGFFVRIATAVFGSANERYVKSLQSKIDAISALEPQIKGLTDEQLRERTQELRRRVAAGETLEDVLVEAFAVCREGGRRFLGMRHYDVQLVGGIVLHSGNIAEMVTGEGKTLVATLPAYLNALEAKGVHVVTVNDYLARRDMEWMGPLYMGLGLTVGAIQSNMEVLDRQRAYACDITYGTNNEFGFDYLRDNMRSAARGDDRYPKHHQQSQGPLHYAIIDEVDNILIDEARTPLIISGPAFDDVKKYNEADRVARQLKKEIHFTVNEKDHTVVLTDLGVREAEKLAGVETFYSAGNMEWPHLIDNALKAHYLYQRDVRYVVEPDGKIVIVDEFTGRKMEGRQWSDGLHQAVEAKEGVPIKEETQTLATITLQNFFKLYKKICGMTGTAMTEASELYKIYGLEVIAIPTNRDMLRIEHTDRIYCTEEEKFDAVAKEVEKTIRWDVLVFHDETEFWGTIASETDDTVVMKPTEGKETETFKKADVAYIQRKGRPILIGTTSIEKSERLSDLLNRRGVKHAVLNAKYHQREAEIVAQAGRIGAVTIATNMAGRGTDIILGGNPEAMAWAQLQHTYKTRLEVPREVWDGLVAEIEAREQMKPEGRKVRELGGLYVIGTERHEARRIDLQLRGRCGRQGDPGSSRFFLSLDDDLVRIIIGGEWVKSMMQYLGMEKGEHIENSMVSGRIEYAQQKMEERNFDIRKNLLEYDEVMDTQRKRVYSFRQGILDGQSAKDEILVMVRGQINKYLDRFLEADFGVGEFAAFAGHQLSTQLEPSRFKGETFETAERVAKEESERRAETVVMDAIDENLPLLDEEDEDTSEWNWGALARMANTRWGLNLRDRDLTKVGRANIAEFLLEKAAEAIGRTDLSAGAPLLDPLFGLRTACDWIKFKFGIEIDLTEARTLEPEEFKELVYKRAVQAYEARESEYPVLAGLYRFTAGNHLVREQLVDWARDRFGAELSLDDLKNKQREEIRALLVDRSRAHQQSARKTAAQAEEKLEALFGASEDPSPEAKVGAIAGTNGNLTSFSAWLGEKLELSLPSDEMAKLTRRELEQKVHAAIEDYYRPEMRRMEREVLLHVVDMAWKEHLLAMDYLRSAVAFRGFAQVDPKIEYKREGMRLFEDMWSSIAERVTDLVFKIEQLSEDFVSSTFQETQAIHESTSAVESFRREDAAQLPPGMDGGDAKVEPIRHRGERVGRNDPCPCGSGKKYKQCCMRSRQAGV